VPHAAIGSQFPFEGSDALAQNQATRPQNLVDGREDVVAFYLVFGAIIPDLRGVFLLNMYQAGSLSRPAARARRLW
jgi:hypothetical protein